MKHLVLGMTSVALATGLAACATAETETVLTEQVASVAGIVQQEAEGEPAQRRSSRGGGHSKDNFYDSYDTNSDDSVSIDEYRAERDRGYDIRDADGDDAVLVDEYVAEYEARLAQDLAEMRDRQIKQAYVRFDVLDKDKDGILSRAEFQAAGQTMFDRLDANKDGVVDEQDDVEAY